jgi:hypothetical protein
LALRVLLSHGERKGKANSFADRSPARQAVSSFSLREKVRMRVR